MHEVSGRVAGFLLRLLTDDLAVARRLAVGARVRNRHDVVGLGDLHAAENDLILGLRDRHAADRWGPARNTSCALYRAFSEMFWTMGGLLSGMFSSRLATKCIVDLQVSEQLAEVFSLDVNLEQFWMRVEN